jgi:FtsZ-binding cell division protein ZapB
MFMAGKWSRATPVPSASGAEARRCLGREARKMGQTLQQTEIAALQVQIAALKETIELLSSELDDVRRERDHRRETAQPKQQVREYFRAHVIARAA